MASPSGPRATSSGSVLEPIHQPQLYERIAQQLSNWIREGQFAGTDRLPSERDLAARLGVSRSSVREAVGALALEGIVETRPGAGSYIAPGAMDLLGADAGPTAHPIADIGPFALLAAREVLEPGIARVAAMRGEPSAYAESLLERMERAIDPEDAEARADWNEADRLFHRELAVMSANPVFIAFADHVADLMNQPLWQRLRDEAITVPGRTRSHVAEHRLIYQDIVEGAVEAAALQALNHVQRVKRQMSDEGR